MDYLLNLVGVEEQNNLYLCVVSSLNYKRPDEYYDSVNEELQKNNVPRNTMVLFDLLNCNGHSNRVHGFIFNGEKITNKHELNIENTGIHFNHILQILDNIYYNNIEYIEDSVIDYKKYLLNQTN